MKSPTSWKILVRDVIERMPRTFTLRDVTSQREYFAKYYPDNRFIDAKIRQSLQILEAQGFLRRLDRGVYQCTGRPPAACSISFDPSVVARFKNPTQVTKAATETWVEHNLYCLDCSADSLRKLGNNAKVADFECGACTSRYQVKGTNGRFKGDITASSYGPLLEAARSAAMPHFILVEYDARLSVVVFADGIPGRYIGEERLTRRKRLGPHARRKNFEGCIIDIRGLFEVAVRIVEPHPACKRPSTVRAQWRKVSSAGQNAAN